MAMALPKGATRLTVWADRCHLVACLGWPLGWPCTKEVHRWVLSDQWLCNREKDGVSMRSEQALSARLAWTKPDQQAANDEDLKTFSMDPVTWLVCQCLYACWEEAFCEMRARAMFWKPRGLRLQKYSKDLASVRKLCTNKINSCSKQRKRRRLKFYSRNPEGSQGQVDFC